MLTKYTLRMTTLKDGHAYEIYIKNIVSSKYKNTWLWKDIQLDA